MMHSPTFYWLLTMPIPVWMTVMTGATTAMVAMSMINVIWLRQDMNTLRQDMNARFDRLEADMKELRGLVMKLLARDSITAP